MFSAQAKIRKKEGETVDEIETSVCQALFELEVTSDLKNQLRELQIVGAKEFEVADKRALAIFIPPPQLRAWQILQTRVVRELEKKNSLASMLSLWLVVQFCQNQVVNHVLVQSRNVQSIVL